MKELYNSRYGKLLYLNTTNSDSECYVYIGTEKYRMSICLKPFGNFSNIKEISTFLKKVEQTLWYSYTRGLSFLEGLYYVLDVNENLEDNILITPLSMEMKMEKDEEGYCIAEKGIRIKLISNNEYLNRFDPYLCYAPVKFKMKIEKAETIIAE